MAPTAGPRRTENFLREIRPLQVVLAAIALLITATVFCSLSRGGFIALVGTYMLAILLVWVLLRSNWSIKVVVGMGIVLLLFGLWLRGAELWSRFAEITLKPNDRFKWWRDTLSIIRDFPLFGGGLGSFPTLFQVYGTEFAAQAVASHPHSDYLNLAAEAGLPTMLLIGGILAVFAVRTMAIVRGTRRSARYLNLACLLGAAPVLIQSALTVNFELPANVFLFLSLLALAQAPPAARLVSTQKKPISGRMQPRPLRAALVVTAFLASAVLLCFSWGFYRTHATLRDEQFLTDARAPLPERIAILRSAVRAEPRSARAHARLGQAIERASEYLPAYSVAEAGSHFVQAIAADPLDGHYHFLLGSLYANYGKEKLGQQLDRAQVELEKACGLYPANDAFWVTLGRFYQREGEINRATTCYRRALRLRSYYLPLIVDAIWNKTKSLDLLQQVAPADPETQLSIAEALARKKEHATALLQVDYVLTLDDSDRMPLRERIGRLLLSVGAWKRAEKWIRGMLKQEPGRTRLQLDMVSVLTKLGKLNEAAEIMERIADGHPANAEYLARTADLYSQLKEDHQAERFYERAAQINPAYYTRWGRHCQQRKDVYGVVVLYQHWVERQPNSPQAHKNLGCALESTGNYLGALAEYERAAALDPKNEYGDHIQRAKSRVEGEIGRLMR